MSDLNQEEWKEGTEADDAIIMDVRTAGEWADGIIPKAITSDVMDPQAFVAGLSQLDTSKTYYVYCRSGARSGQACQIMQHYGLKCHNLLGGIMEWQGEMINISR